MSEGESSIKDLFAVAEQLRQQLDNIQASSGQYQSNLHEAIQGYERCRNLADKASLFSPNESADDIATSDLRYLSIDYLIADLLSRDFRGDRIKALEQSQTSYSQYLSRLDDYELLSNDQKKIFQRFSEDKDSFSVLTSNDPSVRRNDKIARFQQEKELKQKIQHLNSDSRVQHDDDAAVRQLRFAELSLNSHQAFQTLDLISQELKILSQSPPQQTHSQKSSIDTREASKGTSDSYSDRLDLGLHSMLQNGRSGPLLSKSGRPLQPFTLLDSRERLRNGVFKPGHNLPTMTIDEYLEEERRRGGIIEGGGEPPVVEPNEDDIEAADRETLKAREWDEFVEENPKGSGNTLNRG